MLRKKEIESPITQNLPGQVIHDFETAKMTIKMMQERKVQGPLVDQTKKRNLILNYLKAFKPKDWNNIPIPLQELSL